MQKPIVLNRGGLRRSGIRLANSTLLRLEHRGAFPARIRIGKSVFWRAAEIEDYVARLADRGAIQ